MPLVLDEVLLRSDHVKVANEDQIFQMSAAKIQRGLTDEGRSQRFGKGSRCDIDDLSRSQRPLHRRRRNRLDTPDAHRRKRRFNLPR